MIPTRPLALGIAETSVPLPCFFPSVSSVKTNLLPHDYAELLDVSGYPHFLVSAYDVENSAPDAGARLDAALQNSVRRGAVILLDSGNYESFWRSDATWTRERFYTAIGIGAYAIAFCFDNQDPTGDGIAIAEDVISRVLEDQKHATGSIVPIVHGAPDILPDAVRSVAEQLCPLLVAVPERALGDGILNRTRAVRRIRKALASLEFYCPLHLLGTGNPLSIAAYAAAGADSFDGLEWCQTVTDHQSGRLSHFHHWDLFRSHTSWGQGDTLPYVHAALLHNLEFYRHFMKALQEAIVSTNVPDFIVSFAGQEHATPLLEAAFSGT